MKFDEFKNQIVLVTGGARGSGSEIVEKFLRLGSKVYSLDKSYKKKISKKKNLIEIKLDVTNLKSVKSIVKLIKKNETKIKCIVNNAGISLPLNSANPEKYWNLTFDVNVKAAFLLVFYLQNKLKKNYSSVVNITSISSKIAMQKNPAYNSSKAALAALTFSQALDFSKKGIRVNAVCPGYIKTKMTKKSFKNSQQRKVRTSRIMLEKYGETLDVANAVIFLASDNSRYINGEEIVIDGGLIKKGI
jgi:NAD(P)-dependent dehydrogenase (short-subunit alcohol dehydrogenase family)